MLLRSIRAQSCRSTRPLGLQKSSEGQVPGPRWRLHAHQRVQLPPLSSVLASETGSVELPHLLSDAEVALCKQVHLREELQDKIAREGYEAVTVKDTYEISRLRAALTVSALRGVASINGIESTAEQE